MHNSSEWNLLPQNRYVRVGSHGTKSQYFSLQQHPLLLAWWLYWYGKPLGFRGQGLRRMLGDFKRLFCATIVLLYHRYLVPPTADKVLTLPVFGHLCLRVHNGYKVFDLRQGVVVKVFSSTANPANVRREIAWARRVGAHHYAPTVRRWNAEERWYEEEYVNGFPAGGSDWKKFLEMLHQFVVPLVARMILGAPPWEVSALEYVRQQSEQLLGQRSKLSDRRLDKTKVRKIRGFVEATTERLRRRGDRRICLVYSHGDFSPKQILMTGHGPVIIDWEAVRNRSALFDLYHIFFRRLCGGSSVPGMAVAMARAISRLQSYLACHASTANSSLLSLVDAAEEYRWIYYIERICLYVEAKKKMAEPQLNKTVLFIDAYRDFEERLVGDASQSYAVAHQEWTQ